MPTTTNFELYVNGNLVAPGADCSHNIQLGAGLSYDNVAGEIVGWSLTSTTDANGGTSGIIKDEDGDTFTICKPGPAIVDSFSPDAATALNALPGGLVDETVACWIHPGGPVCGMASWIVSGGAWKQTGHDYGKTDVVIARSGIALIWNPTPAPTVDTPDVIVDSLIINNPSSCKEVRGFIDYGGFTVTWSRLGGNLSTHAKVNTRHLENGAPQSAPQFQNVSIQMVDDANSFGAVERREVGSRGFMDVATIPPASSTTFETHYDFDYVSGTLDFAAINANGMAFIGVTQDN